mmetsp:Transcript_7067/g.11087  ORF Transcript_7067/g.11087 Transcript_7067/m.11087 type:complete len:353 (-) Transcript_7067:585-1643(-)
MWSNTSTNAKRTKKSSHMHKPHKLQPKARDNARLKATIFDLQPEDKAKIGNLIRKCVRLNDDCQNTQKQATENENVLKKQLCSLKNANQEIIQKHVKLRKKFEQSLKLLQNYQKKMNEMNSNHSDKTETEAAKEIATTSAAVVATQQIQREINELKQVILDLQRNKENVAAMHQNQIPTNYLRATRRSMIYEANNPLYDTEEDDDDVDINLSPIVTPKHKQEAPKPHPYPNLSLAELRKYSLASSTTASSAKKQSHINHRQPQPQPPQQKQNRMDQRRLHQLLHIQSGKFNATHDKQPENNSNNSGDDDDRLTAYLGLSLPASDDDQHTSDHEEQLFLIQHLNTVPSCVKQS